MSSLGDLPAPGLPDFTLSILARNPTPLYIVGFGHISYQKRYEFC